MIPPSPMPFLREMMWKSSDEAIWSSVVPIVTWMYDTPPMPKKVEIQNTHTLIPRWGARTFTTLSNAKISGPFVWPRTYGQNGSAYQWGGSGAMRKTIRYGIRLSPWEAMRSVQASTLARQDSEFIRNAGPSAAEMA